MQELEAQCLDGLLQAPLCQGETQVPEGEIENEGASEIATPAAVRKRTGHVNDEVRTVLADLDENAEVCTILRGLDENAEVRTVLGDLDENAATPKRKRRRKAGKKWTPVLSENQPAPTGEILMCVPHDRPTHDVSRTTERELLRSVNVMTDILKRLDRTTALHKEVQQIFSRLHEHIMACPQEGGDEVPSVTTPLVAPLV